MTVKYLKEWKIITNYIRHVVHIDVVAIYQRNRKKIQFKKRGLNIYGFRLMIVE